MERGEERSIVEMAREARRRIQFLQQRSTTDPQEIYRLFKKFFQVYLDKKYEFTMDELRHEIHCIYLTHSVRERIEDLIEKLSPLEYTNTSYSPEDIGEMLGDFDAVVRSLVTEQKKQRPWLQKLLRLFHKEREERPVISEYPAIEQNDPVTIDINTLLEKIYASLEQNKVRTAKRHYRELNKRYEKLGALGQQRFYRAIHEAYHAIRNH